MTTATEPVAPDLCDSAEKQRPLTERRSRPTPRTTIEAILWSVRERGVQALREPVNIERLLRCDFAARAEINERIKRGIAARGIAA